MIAWLALGLALAAWLLLVVVAFVAWGLVRKVQPLLRLFGGNTGNATSFGVGGSGGVNPTAVANPLPPPDYDPPPNATQSP